MIKFKCLTTFWWNRNCDHSKDNDDNNKDDDGINVKLFSFWSAYARRFGTGVLNDVEVATSTFSYMLQYFVRPSFAISSLDLPLEM